MDQTTFQWIAKMEYEVIDWIILFGVETNGGIFTHDNNPMELIKWGQVS
jgi:hypothetical protein